jgi:hypothetical protein
MDPTAPQKGHKHAPSCILARFHAHIRIPIQNADNDEITNKTIVIPPMAQESRLRNSSKL